jgi:hypothetical protein
MWARVIQRITMKGLRKSGILLHMRKSVYGRSLSDAEYVMLQKGLRPADEVEQRVCTTFECSREGHPAISAGVVGRPAFAACAHGYHLGRCVSAFSDSKISGGDDRQPNYTISLEIGYTMM